MSMTKSKTLKLTQLAILTAIIIVMSFTPLGFLTVGVISITFLTIPVIVGAIVCGPTCGAILGGVFGITSFIRCFGLDQLGTFLLSLNPIYTFVMCIIPRILVGLFVGLIFKQLYQKDRTKIISFGVASISGSILNTVMFLTCLIVFFWNNNSFIDAMIEADTPVNSVWAFLIAIAAINATVEAGVCLVAGTLIAKALVHFIPVNKAEQTA